MDKELIEKQKYEQFIENVCKMEVIWGLENDDGFAMSSSAEYEDANKNALDVICFWSDKALAQSCLTNEWKNYRVSEITLADFIENWCIGMYEDELLVGTDFDCNLIGFEIEPLDLAIDLCNRLSKTGSTIAFENYTRIQDLAEEIKSLQTSEEYSKG